MCVTDIQVHEPDDTFVRVVVDGNSTAGAQAKAAHEYCVTSYDNTTILDVSHLLLLSEWQC